MDARLHVVADLPWLSTLLSRATVRVWLRRWAAGDPERGCDLIGERSSPLMVLVSLFTCRHFWLLFEMHFRCTCGLAVLPVTIPFQIKQY